MAQKVNGDVIERVQNALLSAFNLHDLIRLTRIELGADLEEIVALQGRNLQEITYDLIRWCAAQAYGINGLVVAAHRVVPDNPEVNDA